MEKVYKMTGVQFENAYRKGELPPEQIVRAAVRCMLNSKLIDALPLMSEQWWNNTIGISTEMAGMITLRDFLNDKRFFCDGNAYNAEEFSFILGLGLISANMPAGCQAITGLPLMSFLRYAYRGSENLPRAEKTIRRLYGGICGKTCYLENGRRIRPPEIEKLDIHGFMLSMNYCSSKGLGINCDYACKAADVLIIGAAKEMFPEMFAKSA